MSIYDEFRALRAELFDAFEAPNGTLIRTTTAARTATDRAQGKVTASIVNTSCRVILGTRKVRNEAGAYKVEQIARLDTAPLTGDRLTVGARSWEITTVEEINPDGSGAIIFVAGLK